jgi:hypothetical protein
VDNERKLFLRLSVGITAKLGNETGNVLLVIGVGIGVGNTIAPRREAPWISMLG